MTREEILKAAKWCDGHATDNHDICTAMLRAYAERLEVLERVESQRASDADALNTALPENYGGDVEVYCYPIESWTLAFDALVAGVEHGVRFREVRPLEATLADARRKMRELREWAHGWLNTVSTLDGASPPPAHECFAGLLGKLDALGLTGEEPTQ